MTTRHMYDAIRVNATVLKQFNPTMVAIYLTGSPDIRWTSAEVALFPNAKFIRIDQGGSTAPQFGAHVMDVEPNAYSPADVPGWTSKCTAPRPTVYCDRNDLHSVKSRWKGDIWLAAPNLSDAQAIALAASDSQIVAVQNVFAGPFDRSVVIDPDWPEKAPVSTAMQTTLQYEYWKDGFGWVFPNLEATLPLSSKVRVRMSNGTWSDWTEITPG